MMRGSPVALGMLCLMTASGCGEPTISLEEFVDRRVEEEWMLPGQYVDADQFFADGGHYYNHPEFPDTTPLDEPHIIPLLTKLREEFDLKQYAIILDEPNIAWAVVMRLPEGSGARRSLEMFLDEEDSRFPGMILQEWGNEWLSLDFLDEEEAEMMRGDWEGDV